MWMHSSYKLLESLCHASFTSPLTLKHLQYFIYYVYTFYMGILEEQTLRPFRAILLEALGDLACYRMAVAAMVTSSKDLSSEELTLSNVLAGSSSNPSIPPSSAPDQPSNTQGVQSFHRWLTGHPTWQCTVANCHLPSAALLLISHGWPVSCTL